MCSAISRRLRRRNLGVAALASRVADLARLVQEDGAEALPEAHIKDASGLGEHQQAQRARVEAGGLVEVLQQPAGRAQGPARSRCWEEKGRRRSSGLGLNANRYRSRKTMQPL